MNESTALDNPELDMAEGETEHLISRMHSEWLFRPECRWELLAGRDLTIGEAQILVLSPDVSRRDRHLEERRSGHPRANQISSAMRVSWRGLTLVLGADLERLPADSGWEGVCTRWPSLRNHHALKIPHHASQTAVCERLSAGSSDTEGTGKRFWVATPFSRGCQLPRFDDGEGVARLLAWESRLHLTGLPRQVFTAEEWPITGTRRELEEALRDPDLPAVPPGAYGFPDHYIVAGFDGGANLVDLRHGPGTFVVTQ